MEPDFKPVFYGLQSLFSLPRSFSLSGGSQTLQRGQFLESMGTETSQAWKPCGADVGVGDSWAGDRGMWSFFLEQAFPSHSSGLGKERKTPSSFLSSRSCEARRFLVQGTHLDLNADSGAPGSC